MLDFCLAAGPEVHVHLTLSSTQRGHGFSPHLMRKVRHRSHARDTFCRCLDGSAELGARGSGPCRAGAVRLNV